MVGTKYKIPNFANSSNIKEKEMKQMTFLAERNDRFYLLHLLQHVVALSQEKLALLLLQHIKNSTTR